MSKFWVVTITAALCLSFAAASALAADNPTSAPAGNKPQLGLRARLIKELNLTADQQKQLTQILQTQQQAVKSWQSEHGQEAKDLEAKIKEAVKAGDKEQVKALRQQLAALVQSRVAIHQDLLKAIGGIKPELTKEQIEKARQILQPAPAHPLLATISKLNLDDKQKAEIEDIVKDARAAAEAATDPKAKEEIWKAAVEKIRTTVLTDEQRKKLEQLREREAGMLGELARLNLTEDQKQQIRQALEDAQKKAQAAQTPLEKRQIIQDARKNIVDNILTPDQRKQWQEWKKQQGEQPLNPKPAAPTSGSTST